MQACVSEVYLAARAMRASRRQDIDERLASPFIFARRVPPSPSP